MTTEVEWWTYVDNCLTKAIQNYNQIPLDPDVPKSQPLFIDLIIKLTICRAYANKQTNRFVTAQKILVVAAELIEKIKDPRHPLTIVPDSEARREGAYQIPLDVLEQKLMLHRGFVCVDFNRRTEAKQLFVDCLNVGKFYDVRIRRECVEQLQKLLNEEGLHSVKLDSLLLSFRHRHRDFVFLVNQSGAGVDSGMGSKIPAVKETLLKILNNENGAIESKDNISLIKFAKGLRRIFTLVEKEKNFVQLKNQVEKLSVDDSALP